MQKGESFVLISAKTLLDIGKMVVATLTFSFVTSYWFAPVQGARQVLSLIDGTVTPDVRLENDQNTDDDGSDKASFNTLWPIVMMLITGIIFVIIIIIVCKRFCRNNGRPEWGPRNRSLSLEGVRNSQTSTADRELRDQAPSLEHGIWSVDMSIDCTVPAPHLKPPPYCDKPPAYDDLSSMDDLPKYNTDNFGFSPDDSSCELGESTSDLCSTSMSSATSTSGAFGTPGRVHTPRRYHISTSSSCPNEPPPVYQPPSPDRPIPTGPTMADNSLCVETLSDSYQGTTLSTPVNDIGVL